MTIKDLAKRLQISTATVCRALNPATSDLVTEPLRGRIQSFAQKVSYRPNQAARHLSQGRSQTIAVVVYAMYASTFFDDLISKVVWGIHHSFAETPGWSWKMILWPHGKKMSASDYDSIAAGMDGVLLYGTQGEEFAELRHLSQVISREWKLPLVVINMNPFPNSPICTVSFSEEDAAYQAAAYLLQRDHRHLGVISYDRKSPDMEMRLKAYRRAFADHHYAFDEASLSLADSSIAGGYEATINLFKKKKNEKISAILCITDEMALGAMRALRALGKRCPGDIAVMGFNGEALGEFATPSISTVTQPIFEMAKTGSRLLIDVIEKRTKSPVNLTLASVLIPRESA